MAVDEGSGDGERNTGRVQATTWSIVLSMLMIAAGMLAIGLPRVAGIAATEVVA